MFQKTMLCLMWHSYREETKLPFKHTHTHTHTHTHVHAHAHTMLKGSGNQTLSTNGDVQHITALTGFLSTPMLLTVCQGLYTGP